MRPWRDTFWRRSRASIIRSLLLRSARTFKAPASAADVFGAAELPVAAPPKPDLFSADRPAKIEIFKGGEAGRLCGHCVNYTINPFRQWCARHRREVEATDSCADFAPKPPEKPAPPPEKPKNILL